MLKFDKHDFSADEKQEIKRLYVKERMTQAEIAQKIGRSQQGVSRVLIALGVKMRWGSKPRR